MPTWSQSVYSSNVSEVAYDADKEELLITWKSGKTSAYSGVPEGIAYACANAPSVGQFLNSEIKPMYSHRYV